MASEGMVHALRRVAGLVDPAGQIVDIRPLDERAEFVVCQARTAEGLDAALSPREWRCGWLRETDEGIEYRQAEAAFRAALDEGLMDLVSEHRFSFRHHAPDLPAMRAYLEETWADAVIEAGVERAAGAAMSVAGSGAELVLRETGWLRVLSKRR